jgi:hypothetical protein
MRVSRERAFYRSQGIDFHGTLAPLGVEKRVTGLLRQDLTRDHLFPGQQSADFIGTTRGFRVQLYAVSWSAVETITAPGFSGVSIDRYSPAAHSIGRLTPRALTFESATVPRFRVRKQNLRRAVDADIGHKFAAATAIPAEESFWMGATALAMAERQPSPPRLLHPTSHLPRLSREFNHRSICGLLLPRRWETRVHLALTRSTTLGEPFRFRALIRMPLLPMSACA